MCQDPECKPEEDIVAGKSTPPDNLIPRTVARKAPYIGNREMSDKSINGL